MPLNYFTSNFITIGALKQEVAEAATREIVENSHLATLDDDKLDDLISKIMPNVEYSRSSITVSSSNMLKDDPILKVDESKLFETVSALLIKGARKTDITSFLERISVFQEKFNISDVQMDYILTKFNTDKFAKSNEVIKINSAIKSNFPLFRALYKLERQREQDTVSTRECVYRPIGKNRYLEVRDNQRFFLEIGENGEIYEEELKYGNSIIYRGKERLDINYKNGMEDVEVTSNGQRIRPGVPTSFREIKDLALGNSILKIVEEKMQANQYTEILNDAPNPYRFEGIRYTGEVDTRSRKINWEKFIGDLKNIQDGIPKSIRQALFNNLLYSLLDNTYGTGVKIDEHGFKRREEDVINCYEAIRDDFKTLLEKDRPENIKNAINKRLDSKISNLNEIRKRRVEKSSKTAAISFETPEAKDKYFRNLKKEQEMKEAEESQKLQTKLVNYDYGKFIEYEENTEQPQFSLSGVYTTNDIDTRNRMIKISEFADSLKVFLENIPEDKRDDVLNTMLNKMMERAFGITSIDLKDNNELNQATIEIKSAITSNIINGDEINEESLIPDMELLNNFHKELAERNKAHSLIGFKDENTRKMFDVITSLVKSGVAEGEMETQVRTLIQIHNDMMKEKENRTDSRE